MVRDDNRYHVITYKVIYNNKTGHVRFWLPLQDDYWGKGIYGLFEEHFYQTESYSSHNFAATLNRTGKQLALEAYMVFGQKSIKTGKDLGEYIFKAIMERIK